MGKQTSLVEHELCHGTDVFDRGGVAMALEPIDGHGVAQLRTLTKCEQRLMTSLLGASAGDFQNLLGTEIRRIKPCWGLSERAVPALVTAKHREGDEYFRRVGHDRAKGFVSDTARLSSEFQGAEIK